MTEIWIYQMESYAPEADLGGFDVEASDGGIGKVDEATNEAGTGHLVVDTGFWIFGKRRVLPAGVIRAIDLEDRKVYIACTKEQVKQAPDYEPNRFAADREQVEDYYGRLGR